MSSQSQRTKLKPLIRLANPNDALPLNHLIHKSYREPGGWTSEQGIIGGERISLDQLKFLLSDKKSMEIEPIFVAELLEDSESTEEHKTAKIIGCIQPYRSSHKPRASKASEEIESVVESSGTELTVSESKEVIPDISSPTPLLTDLTAPILSDPQGPNAENESTGSNSALIRLFGVLPSFQSHGIGRLLINAALDHIKYVWKCEKCVVWVLECHEELLKWYEKIGFVWKEETMKFVAPELLIKEVDFRVLEKVL